MQNLDLAKMIESLRPLMADQDNKGNFVYPSLLKEVPSVTLPYVGVQKDDSVYGELGRGPEGNRRRATASEFGL
jgi:hypothetical protein